jgi:hypothetical protein
LAAEEFITPREIARDFIGLLNILHEDRRLDFDTLVYRDGFTVKGFAAGEREFYADMEI